MSADNIHRAGDNAHRGDTGHQLSGTTGDARQFVNTRQFTQQAAERTGFPASATGSPEQSGEQQRQI